MNIAIEKVIQMKKLNQLSVLLVIVLLTSCGGGGGGVSIKAKESSITVIADPLKTTTAEVEFEVSYLPANGLYAGIGFEIENESIVSTDFHQTSETKGNIKIEFIAGRSLVSGLHDNRVKMIVCLDSNCDNQIDGSPIIIETTLTVTDEAHSSLIPDGVTEVAPVSRSVLHHNIVDAEFSKALNSIVVVSSNPRNAVYIYNLDQVNSVNEVPLDLEPTSISIANAGDSTNFAIGHDSKVSFVEYDPINVDRTITKALDVPFRVFDLVVNDSSVFAETITTDEPETDVAKFYEIDINENRIVKPDRPDSGGTMEHDRFKLSPDKNALYYVNNDYFFDPVRRQDLQTRPLSSREIVEFTGEHFQYCGNLWISNDGTRVYTACGHTIQTTSQLPFADTDYIGRILLENRGFKEGHDLEFDLDYRDIFYIESLSGSPLKNELAIVDNYDGYGSHDWSSPSNGSGWRRCDLAEKGVCNSYLSFFTKDNLEKQQSYIFNLMSFGRRMYREKPLFVFYNNEGSRLYVISKPLAELESKAQLLVFHRE